MIQPTFEAIKQYEKDYRLVPVACEIYADTLTPIQVFLNLKEQVEECCLFESVNNGEQWARYSFIGIHSCETLKIQNHKMARTKQGYTTVTNIQSPIQEFKRILSQYISPKIEGMPPLTGGLIGYFAYDSVRYVETKLDTPPEDDLGIPEAYFMMCKDIIAFDHLKHTLIFIFNLDTNENLREQYDEIPRRVQQLEKMMYTKVEKQKAEKTNPIKISSNISKEQFIENVLQAKEAIKDGEVFQVVLSRRIEVENAPDAFEVYRKLRTNNPSPYMYYFQLEDQCIVGSSPEMLVKVEGNCVTTKPIAGTVKRGKTPVDDERLARQLLEDKKERAEHTMLVDLGRNDIGRVCAPTTVQVANLMHIEKSSQVMHIVTDITGELESHKDAIDALMAVLPAGTLSGAPKVRAMELIDAIEPNKRGLYGGTVGYLGFNGDLDTCIVIRTILYKNNRAYIQAGAGIVADSIPENEYEETSNKAKAMLKAIEEVRESNDFNYR